MDREPLPLFPMAAAIAVIDALSGPGTLQDYETGHRAVLVKGQNLLWAVLLVVATYWAASQLTGSRVLGALGGLLVSVDPMPLVPSGVSALGLDTLYTDLAAAALLTLASALLVRAWRGRTVTRFALAGLAIGLLALTKATFLYVFVGIVAVLVVVDLWGRRRRELRIGAGPLAAFVLAFLAAIVPWMTRNYLEIGRFQLTERGGIVLLVRALQNDMTPDEYRGAIYVWAPPALKPALGRLLGYGPQDVERGGRLQRLSRDENSSFAAEDVAAELAGKPESTFTYYREAKAVRTQLEQQAQASGQPPSNVDSELQKLAFTTIAAHPLRHLGAVPLYLWRGALVWFPVLVVTLVFALRRRDYGLALFALPTFGMVVFYALLSHFILRYGLPASPIAIVCAIVLAQAAAQRWLPTLVPRGGLLQRARSRVDAGEKAQSVSAQ
jgi:hypothetical protein